MRRIMKKDIQTLREILLKDARSWGELLEETKWSPSLLKTRIDFLEKSGELTTEAGKRKGRRTTIYKLVDKKKSEARVQQNIRIAFIESIEDPASSFQSNEEKKTTVSVFASPVKGPSQKTWQKSLDNTAKSWLPWADKLIFPKTKPGLKVAVILTKES